MTSQKNDVAKKILQVYVFGHFFLLKSCILGMYVAAFTIVTHREKNEESMKEDLIDSVEPVLASITSCVI